MEIVYTFGGSFQLFGLGKCTLSMSICNFSIQFCCIHYINVINPNELILYTINWQFCGCVFVFLCVFEVLCTPDMM